MKEYSKLLWSMTMLLSVACGVGAQDATSNSTPFQSLGDGLSDRVGTEVLVSGPSPFPAGCFAGPSSPSALLRNEEVESQVAVDPSDPAHLVGIWRQDRWVTGGSSGNVAAVSRNGGETWTRSFAPLTYCSGGTTANGGRFERSSDPSVSISPNGVAHQIGFVVNLEKFETAMVTSRSANGGTTWSNLTVLRDDVSLDSSIVNDRPSITADPTDSRFVYAIWAQYDSLSTFHTTVRFSRSTDNGRTWTPDRTILNPAGAGESTNHQILVLKNGSLLDTSVIGAPDGSYRFATMRSQDHGTTWGPLNSIDDIRYLPTVTPQTQHPVRAGDYSPSVAVDRKSGRVYVVFEDSRFSGGKFNDVALITSDDGITWTKAVRINNQMPRAGVFTPTVSANSAGGVAILYYDFNSYSPNSPPATLTSSMTLVESQICAFGDCRIPSKWGSAFALTPPFDLAYNTDATEPYFVGDYVGMVGAPNKNQAGPYFLSFLPRTNASTTNRTDIFSRIFGAGLAPLQTP